MVKKPKQIEWTVLGRIIGMASGWDQADTFSMMLYDFEPAEGVNLPAGTLCIDFEHGYAETYDDAGNIVTSQDLLVAISTLPIQPKEAA
jgi:hypothetical protein